ncbi:MAG: 23S rRNA (adenine(2030)-N(6))-methyltransferase RlmJ [Rubellimicrobium sp.]|nr:23S rRNA (adenine(2030)-N(6))-methyltransferase RlmJ [Rubellimicrobium sp.]
MLSYQHIYHAGNLADVQKHALLAHALDYLTQKPKPLSYIETHAGRGLYDLAAPEALKTGEAQAGIARAGAWFDAAHPYARALAATRAAHGATAYPGSPLIADRLLRPEDTIHLAELHPQEHAALETALHRPGDGPTLRLYKRDGAELALSLTPPEPRRGLCLIDPSYEVKDDYAGMAELVLKLHRKWPVGIVMLWYPLLEGAPHDPMLARLAAIPGSLRHEVRFPPARSGHRMHGSGLFTVNPPYGLAKEAARLSERFATLAPARH